jgi:hypothetical protein
MPRNNSKTRKTERRERAVERQAAFDALTLDQKYQRANPGSKEEWKFAIQLDQASGNDYGEGVQS